MHCVTLAGTKWESLTLSGNGSLEWGWQALNDTDRHRITLTSTEWHRQTLSDTDKDWVTLTDTQWHWQALSDTDRHWVRLTDTEWHWQAPSDTKKHWVTLTSSEWHWQALSDTDGQSGSESMVPIAQTDQHLVRNIVTIEPLTFVKLP